MNSRSPDLVLTALRDPTFLRGLSGPQWDLLMRQANQAHMWARLACLVQAQGAAADVPAGPAAHLEGAQRLVRAHRAEVEREVEHVRLALAPLGVRVILLKGAAYLKAGLPAAQGRLFTDIDILVPKARLAEVESALMLHGWATTHHSAYDQRYYRQWMHELPPLMHIRRQTALDVHHAIAPETGRWQPNSAKLQAAAIDLPGSPGLAVLAPADMVLHSMVHLLLNEELSHGLRDLSDIDLLLRDFGGQAGFWPHLVERAEELGLQRALHHALGCASEVLGTPLPESVRLAIAAWGPAGWADALLHAAWRRGLRSPHPSAADRWTGLALFFLYVRAHWLRMPPLMLTRHLSIKALGLNLSRAERAELRAARRKV